MTAIAPVSPNDPISRSAEAFRELRSVVDILHSGSRFSITRIPRPDGELVRPEAVSSWNDLSRLVPLPDQVEAAGNVQTVGRFRVVRVPLRPGTDQTAAADPRTSPNDDEDLIQF